MIKKRILNGTLYIKLVPIFFICVAAQLSAKDNPVIFNPNRP